MNKKISSYYTNELNKMGEIQNSIIEHLRKDLITMGEQGFIYDDDTNVVPVSMLDYQAINTLIEYIDWK